MSHSSLFEKLYDMESHISCAMNERLEKKMEALSDLFGKRQDILLKETFVGSTGVALLDHLFYECLKRVEEEDKQALDKIENNLPKLQNNLQKAKDAGLQLITLHPDDCRYIEDSAFSSPIYLYDFVRAPEFRRSPLLESGLRLVSELGFESLLSHALGLAVLLDRREGSTHLESYTITALHGTIFLDFYEGSLRNAETLVHESAHNWLNYAFGAFNETLPETPTWWSPWRGVPRPMAGILHGVFAFGWVMEFLARAHASKSLDKAERRYASDQIEAQANRMVLLKKEMPDLISHLDSSALAELIIELYNDQLKKYEERRVAS